MRKQVPALQAVSSIPQVATSLPCRCHVVANASPMVDKSSHINVFGVSESWLKPLGLLGTWHRCWGCWGPGSEPGWLRVLPPVLPGAIMASVAMKNLENAIADASKTANGLALLSLANAKKATRAMGTLLVAVDTAVDVMIAEYAQPPHATVTEPTGCAPVPGAVPPAAGSGVCPEPRMPLPLPQTPESGLSTPPGLSTGLSTPPGLPIIPGTPPWQSWELSPDLVDPSDINSGTRKRRAECNGDNATPMKHKKRGH